MEKTNKQIVQEFFDEIFNRGHYEKVDELFSQNCPSVFMPHIGLGFQGDISQDKLIVEYVIPGGPSEGKLMVGDEIVCVEEAGQVHDTFDGLRDAVWGLGPLGIKTQVRVKRDGKLIDLELMADRISWTTLPYTLEQQKRDFLSLPKEWKDIDFKTYSMVEEGNQVVATVSISATNLHFNRQVVWGFIWFFELAVGKITSFWGLSDSIVYLRQEIGRAHV